MKEEKCLRRPRREARRALKSTPPAAHFVPFFLLLFLPRVLDTKVYASSPPALRRDAGQHGEEILDRSAEKSVVVVVLAFRLREIVITLATKLRSGSFDGTSDEVSSSRATLDSYYSSTDRVC